ncbi:MULTISPECIES: hypothetical protein [Burkholderia]|uniref:Uncharacterized protein n=1 Tax=Burkholderia cenocepacia TaxID=95486 RepID=A0ABD4URH8_9BURK|nr:MULTISPECIES: hypothetical protein [Burkholderia]HDR9260224.1 hypothetical protein [Burkholderia vietnamiensis]MCW3699597.1 hypothetical protein [Burkholderia cenocepacia]MCW3707201.1 hypothetical protein [Burkholderia cenocepacia]MCW3716968.1 hypothetical protein [Burkholderia cenocepacia]MCW3723475.1 hypothetical protein [Burkholderia cenocepacia]
MEQKMAHMPDDVKLPASQVGTGDMQNIGLTPSEFAKSFQYRERVNDICNMHQTNWLATENELSQEAQQAVAVLAKDSGQPESKVIADVYEAAPGVDAANIADDEDRYGNLDEYGEPLPPLGDRNNGSGDDDDWDDSHVS